MTARDQRFEAAVVDGGAFGAAAFDVATRGVVAGYRHDGLIRPALLDLLLDLLLGRVRPSGNLTQACGGAPPSAARELFVAGPERALYCSVLDRGEVVVMAAPSSMSVALGWALIRSLTVQ